MGSPHQLTTWLHDTESITIKSVEQNVVATWRNKALPLDATEEETSGVTLESCIERIDQGANVLLELRAWYAANQQVLSHYLIPLRETVRCHPQINFHTQAGGRHSTIHPPLATLPDGLRDLVVPEPGTVWLGFDFNQQEPRIQAAESNSRILEAAFTQGEDIHTSFVCALYGWALPQDRRNPHTSAVDADWRRAHAWKGSEDQRRRFGKTTRYEVNYGGDGSQAAKKAVRMGIEPRIAKRAAQVLLQSDPELSAWFCKVEHQAVETRIVRSWDGGRRVFYWVDRSDMIAEMKRQARNAPLQMGGAGLYNLTIVELAEEVPEATFVYGMHDSMWLEVEVERWPQVLPAIQACIAKPRQINEHAVVFPASFKMMDDHGVVTKL